MPAVYILTASSISRLGPKPKPALAEFAFLDADQKTFFPRFCTPAHDACRCYFSRRRHRRCCCCCFFLLVAVDVLLQLM
jgi:hypothetical protein